LALEFSNRSAAESEKYPKLKKLKAGEVAEWFKAPVC
jgi:hypothetical protein